MWCSCFLSLNDASLKQTGRSNGGDTKGRGAEKQTVQTLVVTIESSRRT